MKISLYPQDYCSSKYLSRVIEPQLRKQRSVSMRKPSRGSSTSEDAALGRIESNEDIINHFGPTFLTI